MTGEGPIYVYGVVSSGADVAPPTSGVADAATRLVESNGLAAVVSTVPGDRLRVRRRDLMAHLHALEEVSAQTTVLPFRFGTVLPSEADVERELLQARAEELHELLERFADAVQVNVKATYDETEVVRELVSSNPEIARARERAKKLGDAGYYENIRVGELVAGGLAARRAADAERLQGSLAALASDVAADPVDDGGLLVMKTSFLVDRSGLEGFDAELEAVAAREAPVIRFESFGPLPPAAFVSLGQES